MELIVDVIITVDVDAKTIVDVITNLAAIAVVNVVALNQHHAAQMLYHTLL